MPSRSFDHVKDNTHKSLELLVEPNVMEQRGPSYKPPRQGSGGICTLRVRPLLTLRGSPLSWLESGEVPQLCRCQPARSLPLTHSLSHPVCLVSAGTDLNTHLSLVYSGHYAEPRSPMSHLVPWTLTLYSRFPVPCSPLLLNSVHYALWMVTRKIS